MKLACPYENSISLINIINAYVCVELMNNSFRRHMSVSVDMMQHIPDDPIPGIKLNILRSARPVK